MPLCAFGCPPSSDVPLHRFPNANRFPERLKIWVSLVGGKLETESDYEYFNRKRLCDRHFIDRDRNRNKRLNAIAVPSLYLSGFPKTTVQETQQLYTVAENVVEAGEMSTSSQNVPDKTPGISKQSVLAEHNYTAASRKKLDISKNCLQWASFYCSKTDKMRMQIKNLRSKVSRLMKEEKFESRVRNASKLAENAQFKNVLSRLAKPAQLFLNMQLQGSKKAKGRRFTLEEKVMCLSMFKKGPKCYALMHKYFTLPSVKSMKRLLSQVKLTPGINPIIFEKLKKSLSTKCIQDRLCSLAFDEMSITAQLNFNIQKDVIDGFACNKKDEFANHALVFMAKGVKQNFKQPIAYYFTNKLNKIELKILIKSVITQALNAGFLVINTVCDQSAVNVAAINSLLEDTRAIYLRRGQENNNNFFLVGRHKIIPLFDAPHLIKGIRNNLLTKDMTYIINGEVKKVKWNYYQQVYEADKSLGNLKLLHKLTEEHIDPQKINKMRVKTATQIFSHSVAVVTEHLSARDKIPEECKQLIDITLLLDDIFDSLNVSSLNIPDGKVYRGAIRVKSSHHKLWCEARKVLQTVKFIAQKKQNNKIRFVETTVPSVQNFIRTIDGMEAIWKVLFNKYGLDAMLTRNFNQDPVENFFGNIRSYGVRNNAPNTVAFEGAFKALLLTNYVTPHSNRANCEEDKNVCLENLDFFLKENCAAQIETPDISEEPFILHNEILKPVQEYEEDTGQRSYVCGWVLKKCLKNICKSCKHCRKSLLEKEPSEANKFITVKEYNKKKWLCYPSQSSRNCFYAIQEITNLTLKCDIPKKNVTASIKRMCDIFVNYPFECISHKEFLKEYFTKTVINVLICSWCRSINRILSGKTTYNGNEQVKNKAVLYYNTYKNYKNKK